MVLNLIPLPRDAVAWFSGEMEKRLRRHDRGRGIEGWLGSYLTDLSKRLDEEVGELEAVLDAPQMYPGSRVDNFTNAQLQEIIEEAADVGNFAMMIADCARRELEQRIRNAAA